MSTATTTTISTDAVDFSLKLFSVISKTDNFKAFSSSKGWCQDKCYYINKSETIEKKILQSIKTTKRRWTY